MRYEYKYFFQAIKLHELRAQLLPFIKPDKFASKQPGWQYTVRSIYFDSPDFEMYRTKREHLAHRMKVRLRGYNLDNDDATVFLEIKRKYEAPIQKNRSSMPFGVVKKIFAGANPTDFFPETEKLDNARRFFYQIYARHLRPVVNVIYEREAYNSLVADPENDFRLTLDKNLRAVPYPSVDELFVDRDVRFAQQDFFILEVKFNKYCPVWLKPILASFDLQKGPASKYVMTIDAHPEIQPEQNRQPLFKGQFLKQT